MKKIVSIVAFVACLFMALPAQAQLKFGIKGGLNISKVTFSEKVLDGNNRAGFFVGPMAEFTFPIVGLGVDIAALYNQTSTEISGGYGKDGVSVKGETLKSIELPINLKWTVGLGSTLGVFVAAGPQFGFNVGDGHYAEVFDMKSCYTSFNVGGGVKLIRHLQVGVNYNFGISKLAKAISEEFDGDGGNMKKSTWQISLAYMF